MKIDKYRLGDVGAHISHGLGRAGSFIPEPANRRGNSFVSSLLQTTAQAVGGMTGMAGLGVGGIDSQYAALLEQQMQNQMQMQLVSMVSNTEKAKHETHMAPVRNLKVG